MGNTIVEPPPPPPPPIFELLPKIINGGIAGIIGVSSVFPLDLVKTRLQNQQIGPNGELMYKSMLDCFKKTYRAEGFFGMYKGLSVNVLLVTPEKAIKLAANDFFRHHLKAEKDGELPINLQMAAGGLAALCQIIVTTPMELLKIQMQDPGRVTANAKSGDGCGNSTTAKTADIVKTTETSATKIASKLLREKGIFGLYRGTAATGVRDVTFSIIYFPLFATFNKYGLSKSDGSREAAALVSLASGCAAGSLGALAVTPFDVVKTRLQASENAKGEYECNSFYRCFRKIIHYEGPKALFKGGFCRMMVIAPLFGIAQMVYSLGIAEALLDTNKKEEIKTKKK